MQGLNKTKAGWQTCPCEYSKYQRTQSIKSHELKPEFKNELGELDGLIYQPLLAVQLSDTQPLGSSPRACSSFLNIRLIHVASDESPSLRISSSSCARKSWANRIWYWSVFGFWLDIVITKFLSWVHAVITTQLRVVWQLQKQQSLTGVAITCRASNHHR